jgi:hypothetical protein
MRLSQVALAFIPALATAAHAGPARRGPLPAPRRAAASVPSLPRQAPAIRVLPARSGAPASADPQILPLSQVRVGMKGYGLTVFHGTKIDRFGFEVLGVLPKLNLGQPYILVRLTNGGPIISRGAFLIHGMSGSPCYVNGRLMGAFSAGEPLAKEPIGFVTPIEPMLRTLDPKLPDRPLGMSAAEFGIGVADNITSGTTSVDAFSSSALFSSPGLPEIPGLGLSPFDGRATPLMASGFGGHALQLLERGLRPLHLSAMPGPGAMKGYQKPIPLQPGSAIGFQLISGDVELSYFGTVTYRRGNQILAFGHPLLGDSGIGPTNFPMTTAYVHDIFPGLSASHWYPSSVKPIGTMVQDRPYAVASRVGPLPPMIPLTCTVDDRSTGQKRVFHASVVNHPLLAPMLIPAAVDNAIYEVHPVPGDATAMIQTEIQTEGFGTIRRENQVFDPMAVDLAAVEDLSEAVNVLARNRFQRIPIKGLDVHVTIEAKRQTASVDRIFVRQEKFEPGDTVEVGVVLRPYRGEPFTTKTQIKVPEYAANGRAALMVSGGPARSSMPGVIVIGGPGGSSGGQAAGSPPNATSVAQLLQQYLEKEKNNQLVTRIVFAAPAVNVAGTTLSQLPSTLADVMRSTKSSSLRTDRDEVKSIQDMDWLLTGAQSLPITIERKDQSEKRTVESGTAKPTTASTTAEASVTFSPSATTVSTDDDTNDSTPAAAAGSAEGSPASLSASSGKSGRRAKKAAGSDAKPKPDSGILPAGAATPPDTADSAKVDDAAPEPKLVGRAAVRWTQTNQADFERGTTQAVGVSSAGDLRLAPRLRPVYESTEPFLWSLAAGDGGVYAGTGNGGLIYRIKPDGEATTFFKTGELEVHALARDPQGNLYAGTSPNGKVFRISPDGQSKLLLALNPEGDTLRVPRPPARFVLSLAVAEDGTVYAGTGPDGRIYRITPDGQSSVFFQTPDPYVMSLLAAGDRLYAGTADSGLVYEIKRSGEARCIYDSDEKAITALARDGQGRLYAASAPKGVIYRITSTGTVTTLWDKSKSAIYALAAAPSGDLYAACGSVIYRVGSDDRVTILSDSSRAQFVALAVGEKGRLLAGSANVGTLYVLEPASEGSFTSAVHDAKTPSQWGQIRWVATTPAGSQLKFETRSGYSPEPDATWSPWAPVAESVSGTHVTSPPARFLQYRVTLSGKDASPVLKQVVVSYLPHNRAPSVALSTPTAGEFWRGSREIKWTGSDPDKDTLTYQLFFSADNGATWKRIGERVQRPSSPNPHPAATESVTKPADPQAVAHALAGNPSLARFRADLAAAPELSEADRQQAVQQADELIARLASETEEETPAAPATDSSSPAAPGPTGSTRESSLHWDTAQVPDGTYLLKVVASDRVSNPSEPLTDEVISDPVMVANQPPRVVCFSHEVRVGADRKALVAGVAEARVPIQGAEYRIDSGDWSALSPSDGIWDGRFEPWSLTTGVLASGTHQLELKVVDAAGNVTTRTVPLQVP